MVNRLICVFMGASRELGELYGLTFGKDRSSDPVLKRFEAFAPV